MPNARDRQLDGLRAVAVTMVLYAHFLPRMDPLGAISACVCSSSLADF